MANDQIIVGLDIGTTKIVAMVGRKLEDGTFEIIGEGKCESLGVQRGVVTNIVQTIESIKKSVEEASNNSGVDIKRVVVGIAGQHIRSYQHRGIYTRKSMNDVVEQSDVDNLIDDMYKLSIPPGEQIIHVLPQEYIIDNNHDIKDPIGHTGNRLEANFHIITGQITAAQNIKRCCEQAGLTLDDLILEPLASAEAVLSNEEKEAGVALIDIGGGTTDVAIFQDGIIRHTAVIPFGGNIITEDIKNGCNIIKNYAELLKVKHGYAVPLDKFQNTIITVPGLKGRPKKDITLRNLTNIINARMSEILEMVNYEIVSSGYADKLSAGIVITGGGSQLKFIKQLTEFITGQDTRVGLPNEYINSSKSDKYSSPIYSTSIGLMMMGFDDKNLVPETVVEHTKVKQHSKRTKGNFFETLINKGRQFFDEDETSL